jgi:hypothetical protein
MHPLLFSKFLDSIVYPICQSTQEPLSKIKPISYFIALLCLPFLVRPKTTLKSVLSLVASFSLLFFHTLPHVCSFLPSSIIGPCYLLLCSSTIVDFKLFSQAPPLYSMIQRSFLAIFHVFFKLPKTQKS